MAARSKARKRALNILFEADQRAISARDVLLRASSEDLNEYVTTLIDGVLNHQTVIDETIETYSEGWPLTRMPAVDRAIARIAVFELLYQEEVPDGVVIDEAVTLAGELSTDDSPSFLNGLLGRISAIKHRISH